jgi:hypothetical protein
MVRAGNGASTVIIEEASRSDDLFEIEVSELRPAGQARRGSRSGRTRLSTRLRARRYVASLLTMALLGLSAVPGERASLPGALLVTPASAHLASQPEQLELDGRRPPLWPRRARLAEAVEGATYAASRGHTMTLR